MELDAMFNIFQNSKCSIKSRKLWIVFPPLVSDYSLRRGGTACIACSPTSLLTTWNDAH